MSAVELKLPTSANVTDRTRPSVGEIEMAMPTPRAIMHVVLRPRYSGAEMLVKALLPLHAKHSCRTAVCALLPSEPAFADELKALAENGCAVFVPEIELEGWQRAWQVAKAIREFQPDIVIAHTVIPAAYTRVAATVMGWRVFPRRDRKLAIAMHAAENDDYEIPALKWSERLLTYFADAVITVSAESIMNYRRRVRAHPCMRRIANGIDLVRFRAAAARREILRDELGLHGQRLLLQVGRLSHVKQQALSLEAASPLLQADRSLQLWFAGLEEEAGYEARLRDEIEQKGLSAQVKVLGSRNDVPELLAAADVYLMPSTMEAHSVALIEALASGVPVVASDIAQFHYAAALPGVALVGVDDLAALRGAANKFLVAGERHKRDLDAFDIAETERQYRLLFA